MNDFAGSLDIYHRPANQDRIAQVALSADMVGKLVCALAT
jgi:hypothetical protein